MSGRLPWSLRWAACFLLTYTFPILNRGLGAAVTFWIYAAICALGFLFVRHYLPETRNKSLESLEKELLGDAPVPDEREIVN